MTLPFISFAQQFEDVLISRCFDKNTGTYVDVGSHHPVLDSMTCAFYRRGWRGLNIDALDTHKRIFDRLRNEDVNVFSAVGASNGTATAYIVPGTGLSTLDESIAERHAGDGFVVETCVVPVETLSALLECHDVEAIDFLKVDVEGVERAVLEGMDWHRWRPKLIIIEATAPRSPQRNSEDWSAVLRDARYGCAFFDGLNEYWIAEEWSDLRRHFETPVNAFDECLRAREVVLQRSFHDREFHRWLKRLLAIFQAGTTPEKEYESHMATISKLPPSENAALNGRRLARTVLGARELVTPKAISYAISRINEPDALIKDWIQSQEYLDLLVWGHTMIEYQPQRFISEGGTYPGAPLP